MPAAAWGDEVGDLPAGTRAVEAESGDRDPGEGGLFLHVGVGVDALFGECFALGGAPGLDGDVGGLDEFAEQPAAVVLAEVEGDRALVGVEVPEAE